MEVRDLVTVLSREMPISLAGIAVRYDNLPAGRRIRCEASGDDAPRRPIPA